MNDITIEMVNTIGRNPEKSSLNDLWYSPRMYPPDRISSET